MSFPFFSSEESIYENAEVVKANGMLSEPNMLAGEIEKYQFGGTGDMEGEGDSEGVSFLDLDLENQERAPSEVNRNVWGVRRSSFSSQSSNSTRASNPTEDKIAKEIREMKEREEELARRWQELQETKGEELNIEVDEEKEEPVVKEERKISSGDKSSPVSDSIQTRR